MAEKFYLFWALIYNWPYILSKQPRLRFFNYDKNEKEEHMEEHEKEKCEYCKLEFEIFALEEHKS